ICRSPDGRGHERCTSAPHSGRVFHWPQCAMEVVQRNDANTCQARRRLGLGRRDRFVLGDGGRPGRNRGRQRGAGRCEQRREENGNMASHGAQVSVAPKGTGEFVDTCLSSLTTRSTTVTFLLTAPATGATH